MEKENVFDKWIGVKKILDTKDRSYVFKEGDIWWISIGKNIGSESYGKGEMFRRPVLILKKLNASSCIIAPLTSKQKEGTWFIDISFRAETSYVLLHQIRMIHTNRFQRRMAFLDEVDVLRVKQKLKQLLEL